MANYVITGIIEGGNVTATANIISWGARNSTTNERVEEADPLLNVWYDAPGRSRHTMRTVVQSSGSYVIGSLIRNRG